MEVSLVRHVMAGKTLARYLFNREVKRHTASLRGDALDLAGGASYARFLPPGLSVVRTNIAGDGMDQSVDFEKPLPFPNDHFDAVFLFNAIYIARDPLSVVREIHRVVRRGGTVLIASPFMQNEMPEPHDFRRLTREGLRDVCERAGFSQIAIEPYGERFSVAANLLHTFWYFRVIRLGVYPLALALDALIPRSVKESHPAPLGYFCVLTKV